MKWFAVAVTAGVVLRFVFCIVFVLRAVSIQAAWIEPLSVLARAWDRFWWWA